MKAAFSPNFKLSSFKKMPQETEKMVDSTHSIYQKAILLACNYAIQFYAQSFSPIEPDPNNINTKHIDIIKIINKLTHIEKNSLKHLEAIDLLLIPFQELSAELQRKQ